MLAEMNRLTQDSIQTAHFISGKTYIRHDKDHVPIKRIELVMTKLGEAMNARPSDLFTASGFFKYFASAKFVSQQAQWRARVATALASAPAVGLPVATPRSEEGEHHDDFQHSRSERDADGPARSSARTVPAAAHAGAVAVADASGAGPAGAGPTAPAGPHRAATATAATAHATGDGPCGAPASVDAAASDAAPGPGPGPGPRTTTDAAAGTDAAACAAGTDAAKRAGQAARLDEARRQREAAWEAEAAEDDAEIARRRWRDWLLHEFEETGKWARQSETLGATVPELTRTELYGFRFFAKFRATPNAKTQGHRDSYCLIMDGGRASRICAAAKVPIAKKTQRLLRSKRDVASFWAKIGASGIDVASIA